MQFILARKRNSVKETPGSDLLYENNSFALSGVAPHSPAAGDGRCSMTGLLSVGDESFKVSFNYGDYASEPFIDYKTGEKFYIDVQDGDQLLHVQCYRIEHVLANCTAIDLVAEFNVSSMADTKPSFCIIAGGKPLGGRWILNNPKEDFIYAVQRMVSRKGTK